MRVITFANGEYYHVYNRGVDKRRVFLRASHYGRFLRSIDLLLNTGSATERLIYNQGLALKYEVAVICYCLMPNHYHFLLKQLRDGGVTKFMHNLNTSYTMYFNLNGKRSGRLFEYTFKAKHIESDEQLLHVSRYIHLNPLLAKITDNLSDYPWSSYPAYIGLRQNDLCQTDYILGQFSKPRFGAYEQFVMDQVEYAMLLKATEDEGDEDRLFFEVRG